MKKLLFILIMLLVGIVSMVSIPEVDAHHKDDHDKGGKKEKRTVEVTGSLGPDNPFICCGVETYTITSTGNPANSPVYVSLASPGCCSGSKVWTDENGVMIFNKATGAPGTYQAAIFRLVGVDIFTDPIYVTFEVIPIP